MTFAPSCGESDKNAVSKRLDEGVKSPRAIGYRQNLLFIQLDLCGVVGKAVNLIYWQAATVNQLNWLHGAVLLRLHFRA
jgi:hypothetical protein